MTEYEAASGHWSDIQDAVDLCAAGDTVFIPAGNHNFINVDEEWGAVAGKVNIHTTVNIRGATCERGSLNCDGFGTLSNMNQTYETVLTIPWAADLSAVSAVFFLFVDSVAGAGYAEVKDIKFRGYYDAEDPNCQDIDYTQKYGVKAIYFPNCEFRVHHCMTEFCRYGFVHSYGLTSHGLIDHSVMTNPIWFSYGTNMIDMDVGYAIYPSRVNGGNNYDHMIYWDDDANVLGKYTGYSVYVEDCWIDGGWRHWIAGNSGIHWVSRHNIIGDDHAFQTLDAHGWSYYGCEAPDESWFYRDNLCKTYMQTTEPWASEWTEQQIDDWIAANHIVAWVGTRAFEVYECIQYAITSPMSNQFGSKCAGGSSVHFNNTIGNVGGPINIYLDNPNEGDVPACWNKIWIWDNTFLDDVIPVKVPDDPKDTIVYEAPEWYTSYTYPHPLNTDLPAETTTSTTSSTTTSTSTSTSSTTTSPPIPIVRIKPSKKKRHSRHKLI